MDGRSGVSQIESGIFRSGTPRRKSKPRDETTVNKVAKKSEHRVNPLVETSQPERVLRHKLHAVLEDCEVRISAPDYEITFF